MAFLAPLVIGALSAGGAAAAGGTLATAASVGASALGGFSALQQGMYQSAVAKQNAKIAGENAERANYAAQIEQMRSDREYRAMQGTLVATQAASGFDILGRSQVMSRANLARVRGEAAEDIIRQGLFDVRNLQQEQANFLGEARAAKTQAWMGLAATAFDIGGTLGKSKAIKKNATSLIGGTR